MEPKLRKPQYRFAAVARTIAVADEIVASVSNIFGESIVGKSYTFSEPPKAADADFFLCFNVRVPELAQKIDKNKIIGIQMIPTPRFCITLTGIPAKIKRWVFCNGHKSAQLIIDYCEQFGLPVDNYGFITYDDTPEDVVIENLKIARCIVGVSVLVGPDRTLMTRFGKYVHPDCKIIPVERVLSPESIAAVNRWIIDLNLSLERQLIAKNEMLQDAMVRMEREINHRMQMQEQLEYESTHDVLTGCYSRRYFEEELQRYSAEERTHFALMVLDLDNLKHINDTFGHSQGDEVLKQTGRILRQCFRETDIVARIGGDEFAALLPSVRTEEVDRIMERIRSSFKHWDGEESRFTVRISAGWALGNESHISPTELFKEADNAMYRDKSIRASSQI